MADKVDLNKLDEILQPDPVQAEPQSNLLSPEELQALDQEAQLEQKYRDKEIQSGLTAAASGATLGISDQLLTKWKMQGRALYTPEELREIRERSPVSATAGEVVGFAAPLLVTGPAAAAGIGTQATVKAGAAAEKLAAKVLQKAIKDTGRKSLANAVIKKGVEKAAAGTAEGALLGVGETISEDALGQADFNAENLISNVGAGALIGGSAGGLLGASSATLPAVKKGLAPIGARIKKSASAFLDPEEAAKSLAGVSLAKEKSIQRSSPKFFSELPEYIRTELKPGFLPNPEALQKANLEVLENSGNKIGSIGKTLDKETQAGVLYPRSRREVAENLKSVLREEENFLAAAPGSNRPELRVIERFKQDLDQLGAGNKPFTFSDLESLRKNYQKKAYRAGRKGNTFTAQVADKLRYGLRQEADDMAEFISSSSTKPEIKGLAEDLKVQNKRYHTASTLRDSLESKAIREGRGSKLAFRDLIETILFTNIAGPAGVLASAGTKFLRSDMSKNLAILADVQKANQAVDSRLKKSVNNFFSGTKRVGGPVSTKILTESGFALEPETKKRPKSKQEAFKNMTANFDQLKSDPNFLIDRLAKTTLRTSIAAPQTALAMQGVLERSVAFLDSKIPKDPSLSAAPQLFKREYKPSSMEIAKFERYVQAVEAPMTVLEDLENGTATREQVEAIKAVYPNLYSRIQTAVIEKVSTSSVSYSKRIQLGTLLDIPTDESLLPQSIQALQANFTPQDKQADAVQPAVNPTVSGASSINKAERETTDLQRVAAGPTE